MCRIAGIVTSGKSESFLGLSSMLSSMAKGGPDDEGNYIEGNIAFGHRRLSIIDLSSAGHQPMVSTDSNLVISFNGEIYNYLILKEELKQLGYTFQTKTDTEVILYAYQQWGTSAFNRFEGMFAFSLYDKVRNALFLVRDHIGVKPLYYSLDKNELIFASEVRAFTALRPEWKVNPDWKILFLAFGSMPHPATTLAGVYQLEPGCFLELDLKNFSTQINKFYTPSYKHTVHTQNEALQIFHKATRDALQKNLIADAPLGIFLSGGIDSSLLTLLADELTDNVKTISVNFEDASYDERPYQDMVLKQTNHTTHKSYALTEKLFWAHIEDIWQAMDQPSIDGVNSYFVSLCARQEGLKAVLSGLGADEIFGGYKSTNRIQWVKHLRLLPFKKIFSRLIAKKDQALKRLVYLTIPGTVGDYLFLRGIHTPDTIASILEISEKEVWKALKKIKVDSPAFDNNKEYVSFLESKIYMTNQLLKDTDYMSMWHGLEVRVPFLDIELINKAQSVDPSLRYNDTRPKYLITASNKDTLPDEIVFRKKNGFTFPFALWIKNNPDRFRQMLPQNLSANLIVQDFEAGRSHWSKYWSLVVVSKFGTAN